MRNLKTYKLEKLDALPIKLGMHKHYKPSFQLECGWYTKREYHGEYVYKRTSNTVEGSVGKTKAEIVAKLKLWYPSNWCRSVEDEVDRCTNFKTKIIDGVLMLSDDWRHGKDYCTLEETIIHARGTNRSYWYRGSTEQYYFDENNILRMIPSFRKAKPGIPDKKWYEDRAAKHKAAKIERTNEEILQKLTTSFVGNADMYAAFSTLRKAWKKAHKDVSEHFAKSIDPERPDYWRSWNRYMWRNSEKELKTLTADMNAVNEGDYSVLNVYLKAIQEKRQKEQERLSIAA